MRGVAISVFALLALAGCETFSFHQYSMSQRNIDAIKQTMAEAGKSTLAIGEFNAAASGLSNVDCGINGQIRTPHQVPFVQYIRDALIDEVKKANAYSLDQIEADKVITGYLDNIKLNSSNGSWDFKLIITFKSGKSFTVMESYPFDGSSCEQSAAAFNPAVQDLIFNIINHPVFREELGLPGN